MIDCHYGHLVRDGREHAIRLLDVYAGSDPSSVHRADAHAVWERGSVHRVDAAWTSQPPAATLALDGSGP